MKKTSTPDLLDAAALRMAAADLLSRREHSRRELLNKLASRANSIDELHQVLDDLIQRGWQSDRRYTESFVRGKSMRHTGPIRVSQELRQKGIDDMLAREVIRDAEVDWFDLAADAGLKKAVGLDLADQKQKAKLYRFLAYRGFSADQIQYAMECCARGSKD